MPHPKNRIKLTGDTHPPELDDILLLEDEPAPGDRAGAGEAAAPAARAQPRLRALASGPAPASVGRLSEHIQFGASPRQHVLGQPLAALGTAFVLGWIFGKLSGR